MYWLQEVWTEIHQQDPSIHFQVISRDERCKMLGHRIAPEKIRFVSSSNFSEVAGFLHESEVGFLLRKDTIVNRVCFPTKLGEYLASGSWVVTSDIDWDVKDYFELSPIGLLVDPDASSYAIARKILDYRSNEKHQFTNLNFETVRSFMDRKSWIEKLKRKIR